MTRRPALMAIIVSLAFLTLELSLCAQTGGTQGGQSGTNPPGAVSPPIQILVTGCLKRGNDGGYRLTDQNGTTWELSSKDVNLAGHVMHSVTVTGKPGALSKSQEANNQQSDTTQAGGRPTPSLQVLTLKVLSPSCTR